MTNTVTSADGTTIAYERTGSGPAVILIGGAFNDRSTTAQLADALAPYCTAYRYDRRGRGDSGDTAPYTPEREIEDLAAVIEAAGGSAFVFGHSSGAVLALEAAAAGLPITRLAVYEAPFVVGDSRRRPPADLRERLAKLVEDGQLDEAATAFMVEGADVPAEMVEMMKGDPSWGFIRSQAHTVHYDVALFPPGHGVPAGRLAGITAPTLVLDGGASPGWFHSAALAVAEAVPGAESVTIDGEDHGVLARPEHLLPELTRFFAA